MTAALDRDRLAKILALLASPLDGEALAATRAAVKMLGAAGLRSEQLAPPEQSQPIDWLASFRYRPAEPATRPGRPQAAAAEPVRPTRQRKPPPPDAFQFLGPQAARQRLQQLLASPLLPKPRAFIDDILARLDRPHPTGGSYFAHLVDLTGAETRRLNAMWRAFCELKAAA